MNHRGVNLSDQSDMPVNAAFAVELTHSMDTPVLPTVIFLDADNDAVSITKVWTDEKTLSVVPASDLLHNASYTFGVGLDAKDAWGNTIGLNSKSMVMFKAAA